MLRRPLAPIDASRGRGPAPVIHVLIPLPARTIVRWRWPIVVAWVAIAAAMWPLAREIHNRLQVGGRDLPGSESTQAETIIRSRFATSFSAFGVVAVRHATLSVDSTRYGSYVDSLARALERLPFVQKTVTWRTAGDPTFVSPDGRITFILVGMRELADGATSEVPLLREAVHAAQARVGPDFITQVTGSPAFDYDTRTVAAQDSDRLEQRLLPLTWLLLILAFGALVAAFVPVAVGFLAIFVAMGIESMLAGLMPMSIFVLNITTMVGLGVGIDYSLLVVTRFREELDSGADRLEAAERTIRTAAQTVLTSGGTVMVGVAALMIVPIVETRSVGLGGLIVVFTAVALSVTFLPAILAILGHNVDRPKFLAAALARFRQDTGWTRYAESIARNPIRALAISGVIILALAAPALWLRIGLPAANWFPKDTESARGLAVLQDMGQGGALQPIRVLVQMPTGTPVLDLDRLRGLRILGDSLRANPRVQQVRGLVDLRPGIPLWQYVQLYGDTARARARMPDVFNAYLGRGGSTTVLNVFLRDTVTLNGALQAVREVRRVSARHIPTLERARLLVGGFFPSALDFQDRLLHEFSVIVLSVLGVTAVMLAWVFKSLLVPVKAVVMNTLSVGAAFGLTVLVFQWGIGGSLIGLEAPTKAIFVMGPVLVFAIVFGLSMDYEVFLLSRIKEEFDLSHDNDAATIAGLSATGRTITSAAGIMILVFGAFAFARVMAVQMIGFGLAVAVLLDATVIRMVMVPAVMHLAGRFNWWPGYRRRGRPGHYRRGSSGTRDHSA
jgi:RND superfamily putative drug exporter